MRTTIYKGQYGWYEYCVNWEDKTKKKRLPYRFVNCDEPIPNEDGKRIIMTIEGKHNVNKEEQITSVTVFKWEAADEVESAPGIDAYQRDKSFDKNVSIDEEELPFY